jgi:hypothetical protein
VVGVAKRVKVQSMVRMIGMVGMVGMVRMGRCEQGLLNRRGSR